MTEKAQILVLNIQNPSHPAMKNLFEKIVVQAAAA
jgi:hypothetical protein